VVTFFCAAPGVVIARLHEKCGKEHEVLAHHQAEIAMDAYMTAVFPEEKDKSGDHSVD
jgi:hypothetical protein